MFHTIMNKKTYKLSFTAASLLIAESAKVAEVYLNCKDWDQTKKNILENNLLQSRTTSRTIRILRELIQRLKSLTDTQLELLVDGNNLEKKYLLWFAVCKTYEILEEFSREVVHEKYLARNLRLTDLDYDAFFNRKAEWNEELQNITDKTRKKIRQVAFLMMKEAELITNEHEIVRAMMSTRLIEVLRSNAPMSFLIFPVEPKQ